MFNGLCVALHPQTPKQIRGGWPQTDTSEPVVGYMGQMILPVTNLGFEPATFQSVAQHTNHCPTVVLFVADLIDSVFVFFFFVWSSYDRTWFSGPDKQEIFI
jgi:hypothetical protein